MMTGAIKPILNTFKSEVQPQQDAGQADAERPEEGGPEHQRRRASGRQPGHAPPRAAYA